MDDLEEAAVAPAGEGEGLVSLGVVSALGREDTSHMGPGGGVLRSPESGLTDRPDRSWCDGAMVRWCDGAMV